MYYWNCHYSLNFNFLTKIETQVMVTVAVVAYMYVVCMHIHFTYNMIGVERKTFHLHVHAGLRTCLLYMYYRPKKDSDLI